MPIKYLNKVDIYPGTKFRAGRKTYDSLSECLRKTRCRKGEHKFIIDILNPNASNKTDMSFEGTVLEAKKLGANAKRRSITLNPNRDEVLEEWFELETTGEDSTVDFSYDYGLVYGDRNIINGSLYKYKDKQINVYYDVLGVGIPDDCDRDFICSLKYNNVFNAVLLDGKIVDGECVSVYAKELEDL